MNAPEPKQWTTLGVHHSEYNGRQFYGQNADDNAELHYLRDYKQWAERQLCSLHAFERSVNEALNTGDGSYRP